MPVGERAGDGHRRPGRRAPAPPTSPRSRRPRGRRATSTSSTSCPTARARYLTCGDDDARAFAGRAAAASSPARARCSSTAQDALRADRRRARSTRPPPGARASSIGDGRRDASARSGAVGDASTASASTRRDFDTGPAVDTTGDRDLLCAAYAWADLRGADAARPRSRWAQLYAEPRDDRADRHRRRRHRGAAARGRREARARPALACARLTHERRRTQTRAAMAEIFLGAGARGVGLRGRGGARRRCARRPSTGGEIVAEDERAVVGFVGRRRAARSRSSTRTRARGAAAPGRALLAAGEATLRERRLHRGDAVDGGAQRAPPPRLRGGRLGGRTARRRERVWNGAPLRELPVPQDPRRRRGLTPGRGSCRGPAVGLVLLAVASLQVGAAFAVELFDELGPAGAAFGRLAFAARDPRRAVAAAAARAPARRLARRGRLRARARRR